MPKPFHQLLFSILLFGNSCGINKKTILLGPGEHNLNPYITEMLDGKNNSEGTNVEIQSKFQDIDVAVMDSNNQQIRGFGLVGGSKAVIFVGTNERLLVKTDKQTRIRIKPKALEKKVTDNSTYIPLKLVNGSAQSIPLVIPGVMNPNLSPFSKSGVELKVGQRIFVKQGLTKKEIFQVLPNTTANSEIQIHKLLK